MLRVILVALVKEYKLIKLHGVSNFKTSVRKSY